ncbi:MAG: sigma-70 family RNA polymerase sigma factor, partial [Polyangiaceae bacterium]
LSLRLDAAQVDDAVQTVWRDLLTGAAPRIAQYDGSGDLKAWLRVAATRIALRASKKAKREVPDDDAIDIADGAAADPELMLLKAKYRAHFHEAVKVAIENMPASDAMLLRQHFVDGLGIDQLGKLYDIHRATAARRLQSSREALVDAIRVEFKKSARLADSEAESVLRLVRSSLDITLRRHFAAR